MQISDIRTRRLRRRRGRPAARSQGSAGPGTSTGRQWDKESQLSTSSLVVSGSIFQGGLTNLTNVAGNMKFLTLKVFSFGSSSKPLIDKLFIVDEATGAKYLRDLIKDAVNKKDDKIEFNTKDGEI